MFSKNLWYWYMITIRKQNRHFQLKKTLSMKARIQGMQSSIWISWSAEKSEKDVLKNTVSMLRDASSLGYLLTCIKSGRDDYHVGVELLSNRDQYVVPNSKVVSISAPSMLPRDINVVASTWPFAGHDMWAIMTSWIESPIIISNSNRDKKKVSNKNPPTWQETISNSTKIQYHICGFKRLSSIGFQ